MCEWAVEFPLTVREAFKFGPNLRNNSAGLVLDMSAPDAGTAVGKDVLNLLRETLQIYQATSGV